MPVLPAPDDTTRFYWEAARRGELHVARCRRCARFVHPPVPACPACGSGELAPEPVSGRGKIHTYTIAHREVPGHPVPFAIVMVELDEQEGLRIVANLVGVPIDAIRVGMPVEVCFEAVAEDVVLPQFRPVSR